MSLIDEPAGFSYPCNDPEAKVVWALRKVEVSSDGAESPSQLYQVGGRVEIEQIIDDHMQRAGTDLTEVAGTLWTRTLHLRDGGRSEFWIILEVIDWRCLDCGWNLQRVDEYYMVNDDLWLSVVPDRIGHLCVGCLEGRLGRELNAADFPTGRSIDGRYTERLWDRVTRRAPTD
ncbi:hypothetical protein VZC37_13030 [Gordonia sp. LSe1-13]|uniref:Uncharacterized protein n=1 Tax=Gordonia sesuvii TaxID=3116777 RepID=A0ABU7MDT3_9ACTN|nr:hypothetical protein [Gordonia sp. LSe1-13]